MRNWTFLSIALTCVATLAMAAEAPLPAYAASITIGGRETAPQSPVARGVMYWMEGCGHCEEVLDGVLPDLQAQYGSQLEIQLIEVVTLEDTDQLYATAAVHGVPKEQVGVPLLIMNGQALVGLQQIPALVAQSLAAGGAEQPSLVQLDADLVAELGAIAPVRPNGFGLAIAIMVGMVASLVYTGASLTRGTSGLAGSLAARLAASTGWLYPCASAGSRWAGCGSSATQARAFPWPSGRGWWWLAGYCGTIAPALKLRNSRLRRSHPRMRTPRPIVISRYERKSVDCP